MPRTKNLLRSKETRARVNAQKTCVRWGVYLQCNTNSETDPISHEELTEIKSRSRKHVLHVAHLPENLRLHSRSQQYLGRQEAQSAALHGFDVASSSCDPLLTDTRSTCGKQHIVFVTRIEDLIRNTATPEYASALARTTLAELASQRSAEHAVSH